MCVCVNGFFLFLFFEVRLSERIDDRNRNLPVRRPRLAPLFGGRRVC